jgi:energy-coupling factor transporter ATP-binding protein EcfA2
MSLEGSQWRRWDLHIHTPGTALNDQFKGWDSYLQAIRDSSDVKVLGVTDYMSIANYSRVKAIRGKGDLSNIELLIPNIEFRVAPPTEKATAVNLHILISPDDPHHEQEISNALARLHWDFNGRRYSCTREQLINLGRAVDPKQTDDHGAFCVGVLQFKVDFTHFRDWYQAEHWLRANSLIAVSAGEDGLSGFRRDGAWTAHRDEITRFSKVIFSGRAGERDFWLGVGSDLDRETLRSLGGPKPCVHGSDAHALEKLFKPDGNRYCWIKADPTFEGLRQILYEPHDRVHIGPTPPSYHDQARVIRYVGISNASGWFDETPLPLNSSLVSIVGQKGSGKSALAELIAYAAGSCNVNDPASFIRRASPHIGDLNVTLEWADGSEETTKMSDPQPNQNKVRYLSQKFVEHLCAQDNVGTELVREIESVIFSNIDPTDTLNASNFEELRAIKTEGTRAEGRRIKGEVAGLIHEESTLREQVSKIPEKKTRMTTLADEGEGLKKQIPPAVTPEEARTQASLQEKYQALNSVQQEVAAEKQKLQKIEDVRSRVTALQNQFTRAYTEMLLLLKDIGVPEMQHDSYRPRFGADTEPPLARRETEIRNSINGKDGALENPAIGTIRWLQVEIKKLTELDTADKAREQKTKSIQARLASINTETQRLETEIKHLEGPAKERLRLLYPERLKTYICYFENLRKEQAILEELYASVRTSVGVRAAAGSPEQELEFSIRWEADIRNWLERGSALFDQRKTIPYGTIQQLGKTATLVLVPAWTSGNSGEIGEAHGQFLNEFRKPELKPQQYLRSGVTPEDLLQWLYEVDHIHLSYGLKYNGVELEKLSPGTKGIVLLILYLGMDVSDSRPLIVDQPDENLDNESIYKLLTAYFKKAKTRRQIILITHNPNLVVNADSEQVIVAACTRREGGLPHITYRSGALENATPEESGIRQQVCRILEGGKDAFLKRERRYSLANEAV